MSWYELLLLLHILLFVYWLGGDLGVFHSSGYIARPDLPPATRATVAKIMLALDLTPRICMVLMLPVGVALSASLGALAVPGWGVGAIWAVALGWLAMVVGIHVKEHRPIAHVLARVDWGVRLAVVAGLTLAAGSSLAGAGPVQARWLAAKMLIFAGTIVCGLVIRVKLKPFGAAFGRLMREGSSPEVESALRDSIARVKPAVLLIWAGLVANAWLGIAKPF